MCEDPHLLKKMSDCSWPEFICEQRQPPLTTCSMPSRISWSSPSLWESVILVGVVLMVPQPNATWRVFPALYFGFLCRHRSLQDNCRLHFEMISDGSSTLQMTAFLAAICTACERSCRVISFNLNPGPSQQDASIFPIISLGLLNRRGENFTSTHSFQKCQIYNDPHGRSTCELCEVEVRKMKEMKVLEEKQSILCQHDEAAWVGITLELVTTIT